MNVLICCCLLLVVVYLIVQIVIDVLVVFSGWKKVTSPEEKAKRRNHIVINGRKYYPKRVGRETDCKTECPLYSHCEKGSYSICMSLQHPYEDVIMEEENGE